MNFIKTCKKEDLIPTVVKELAIKSSNNTVKQKIATFIMNIELQQENVKNHEKRKLKCEMIKLSTRLKSYASTLLFDAVIYSLDKSIKQKAETINKRHHKKLEEIDQTKI